MVPNHARYQLRYTPKQLFYYNDLAQKCQALFPFFYVGQKQIIFFSIFMKTDCEVFFTVRLRLLLILQRR